MVGEKENPAQSLIDACMTHLLMSNLSQGLLSHQPPICKLDLYLVHKLPVAKSREGVLKGGTEVTKHRNQMPDFERIFDCISWTAVYAITR